ncbi:MAG: oligoribonuclease [Acidimicrobiia bacterium]
MDFAERLAWIDLEMTGLDVERDVIVEIGVLVTDSDLNILDPGIDIVIHQSDEVLDGMNEVVQTMHTRSGLLEEIRASTTTHAAAMRDALSYIQSFIPNAAAAPLCGNTIGMDRRFLAKYAPEIDQHLHYRCIDVSSFKELCRRWYPEVYKRRPAKSEAHRAIDDIRDSVAELAFYRAELLRPPA